MPMSAPRQSGRSRWTLPDFGSGETRRGDAGSVPRTGRPAPRGGGYERQTIAEAAIKSVVRSVGSSVGRALVRGILGGLKKGF